MKTYFRQMKILLNQLLVARAKHGPYRFLIKRWDKINEIDLLQYILETDYFLTDMSPVPMSPKDVTSIAVLAPHQDDESIGMGGTILLATDANVPVDIIFITDGAQLGFGDIETSIRIRREESQRACHALGARYHEIQMSNLEPIITLQILENLTQKLLMLKPSVIAIPWFLDTPPMHRFINHILYFASRVQKMPECEVWAYQVHNSPYPNIYVDITSVINRKRQVIALYESQLQHVPYNHLATAMGAWNSRLIKNDGNSGERYIEIFFSLPLREYLDLIAKFYSRDLNKTYKGRKAFINAIREFTAEEFS